MTTPRKVHGADLSHHNPNPDLKKAKAAGLLWLYYKATEGATFVDKTYAARRAAAKAAGVPFGAYHFARPDANAKDAKTEAQFFFKVANPQAGDLVPCLDFEVSHPKAEAWAKEFMTELERLIKGRGLKGKPLHYGPDDWGKDYDYLRWVPRYNNTNTPPKVKWDIWQFSNGVYGKPNSHPGLGNVDLNSMNNGVSLSDFRLTAVKKKKSRKVHAMHASMQFSDTTKQKRIDVKAIFERAKERGVAWITGTEGGAGSQDLIKALRNQAPKYGYRFYTHGSTDAWIAVAESMIDSGWKGYWGGVIIPGVAKKHTAKGVLSVQFHNKELGTIHVIAAHYLTKGRPNAKDPAYRVNLAENRKLATAIGQYAKKVGKGKALVFYGGDQNIVDRTEDTFFGQPLTSAWDELGKWQNTGHGNIDVIASYDGDGRVSAAYCRALNDKKFFLHTDHFLVEAGFDVRLLAA